MNRLVSRNLRVKQIKNLNRKGETELMANSSQRALIYWFLFHEDSVLDSGFVRRNS